VLLPSCQVARLLDLAANDSKARLHPPFHKHRIQGIARTCICPKLRSLRYWLGDEGSQYGRELATVRVIQHSTPYLLDILQDAPQERGYFYPREWLDSVGVVLHLVPFCHSINPSISSASVANQYRIRVFFDDSSSCGCSLNLLAAVNKDLAF
jgi:hypothetical protein